MRKIVLTCLVALVAASVVPAAETERSNTYLDVSKHYEAMRLALLEDSLAGVREHAAGIEESVELRLEDLQADLAGVEPDQLEACRALLPEIATAARQVASGADLDAVRAAFFELSKPLGRYRKLAGDLDSKVAYCPMVKKAWIQPGDEIGNPYLGNEMPNCGQIIAD